MHDPSLSVMVFDSGAGGLSVAKEIRRLLPGLPIHYLMDDEAFPYGIKEDAWLEQRIMDVCTRAEQAIRPSLLVVACNTASTLALQRLRQTLAIPVVGVVPAIKTAAEQTSNGIIGLLATPATVSRPYTNQLATDFASHCTLLRLGSADLVRWAEEFIHQGCFEGDLHAHLDPWLKSGNPSHVVLGCTHFPLLKPQLQQLWPAITWIDSGAAIARRVAHLLDLPTTPTATAAFTLHCTSGLQYPGMNAYMLHG
jgi:glutamate racemase